MRHSYFRLIAIAAFTMVTVLPMSSCGKNEKENKIEEKQTPQDQNALQTPDLTLFGLKGNVKSLKDEMDKKYQFAEDGTLKEEGLSVERNDRGQIVKIKSSDSDTTFTWDKDGKVAESQSAGMKNTFTYDDRGLLLSCLTEVDTWEMSIYRYLEFDDHGNWTKRERQYIGLSSSAEEGEDPTYKGKDTEERVIKYY